MKAVVLEETRKISVREVPDAEMQDTTDVLLRITSTAICGTDLHFYEGRMRGIEGGVIGHEPLGVVEEVGSAVINVKKGDRVTVPTHICCGFCAMCVEGHSSACLTTNPGAAGAAYGYPNKWVPGRSGGAASRAARRCQLPQAPRRARRQLGRRFRPARRRLHYRLPRRCRHRNRPQRHGCHLRRRLGRAACRVLRSPSRSGTRL